MSQKGPIKDVIRQHEKLVMLGIDKHESTALMQASFMHLMHHPDRQPVEMPWPLPGEFEPCDSFRDNLVMSAAYTLCAIHAGDREDKKARRSKDEAVENAESSFEILEPGMEMLVHHQDAILYQGTVEPDGMLNLGTIKVKAQGISVGEMARLIMGHLGVSEEGGTDAR